MNRFIEAIRRAAPPTALFVLGTLVMAAAYCQAPLYYSNQNQYFLHGLADAGQGLLREDWLANTRDPVPVFSALIAFTAERLHPWAFYAYYALLQGAYAAAMLGLFVTVAGRQVAGRRWPAFVALFLVVHSALARWCCYRWLGNDYPWFLQAGLAGQYALGAMFQPSTFGVLLIVSICLFVRGRAYPAVVCAALGATVHSTYLLPAGLLTLGFVTALLAERRTTQALGVAALAFALVLPITVYVMRNFGPTSRAKFDEAQAILVNFRIPHHTQPRLWLDPVALFQMGWLGLGLALARPNRLTYALTVPSLLALLLTLAQVATGSHALALLFPWRVSAVLIPVATAVILSRLVAALPTPVGGRPARALAAAAVLVVVAGGVWISVARQGFQSSDADLSLMDFVRQTKRPGDVYLLPVHVPKLTQTTRGSLSSDFKPLADKKQDGRVIPVDLQRFRLYTGAPIFVDFKSIPFKDTDVLEWNQRVQQTQEWQEQIRQGRASEALAVQMHQHRITHVILPGGQKLEGDGFERLPFEDAAYQVYRVRAAPEKR